MRTYLGVRSSENEIVFIVPRPDIEDYQVYLRYRLIDSVTGYRNNWLAITLYRTELTVLKQLMVIVQLKNQVLR